jgi:hypothetical protein
VTPTHSAATSGYEGHTDHQLREHHKQRDEQGEGLEESVDQRFDEREGGRPVLNEEQAQLIAGPPRLVDHLLDTGTQPAEAEEHSNREQKDRRGRESQSRHAARYLANG